MLKTNCEMRNVGLKDEWERQGIIKQVKKKKKETDDHVQK